MHIQSFDFITYWRLITLGLFTWSGGPRSSGVGFFCFHALGDTKQKKLTPLDRGPQLHLNRVLKMVLFEMTSITVRWRDRVVPGFPSGKKNDFIGRYLIGLQTELKIDEDHRTVILSPSD